MGAIVAYFMLYLIFDRKKNYIYTSVRFRETEREKYHPSIFISGSGIVSLRVFDRDSLQSELLHERTQNSVKAKTQECQL